MGLMGRIGLMAIEFLVGLAVQFILIDSIADS
jgi:hypothetical protein